MSYFWTAESVELLTTLWAEDLSASQIVERMPGTTRGGICGKARRLNLPARGPRTSSFSDEERRARRVQSTRHWRNKRKENFSFGALASPPAPNGRAKSVSAGLAPPRLAEPVSLQVPLIERSPYQCAWLHDDGQCCGQPTISTSSWCGYHAARVFAPKLVGKRTDYRFFSTTHIKLFGRWDVEECA